LFDKEWRGWRKLKIEVKVKVKKVSDNFLRIKWLLLIVENVDDWYLNGVEIK
jgi:hypothetical protein